MKKTLGIALALILAVLAASQRVPAATVVCDECTGSHPTSTYTARGATCQEAKNKLYDKALPEFGAACTGPAERYCYPNLVITTNCFTNAEGKKEVSGYYTYGCMVCLIVPDGPNPTN